MTEYNTTLDTWYQSCPSPIQSLLRSPYETVAGWLQWVTGEPNTVAAQSATYQQIGQQVLQLGQQVTDTSEGISLWKGEAHDAYMGKMVHVRGNFDKLGPAIQQTQEILHAAAETSVEAANMILSLIKSAIEFALTTAAISAALGFFTLGASAVAGAAAIAAKFVSTLAQITKGLARVAQVLERIASLLVKLASIMRKVAEVLRQVRALLKALDALKKGATLGEKALIAGVGSLIKIPTKLAADPVLDGASAVTGIPGLSMPGGAGEAKQAAEDAWDAVSASNRATRANTGVQLD